MDSSTTAYASLIGETYARSLEERLIESAISDAIADLGAVIFLDDYPFIPTFASLRDWRVFALPVASDILWRGEVPAGMELRSAARDGNWIATVIGDPDKVRTIISILDGGDPIYGISITIYGGGRVTFILPVREFHGVTK